VTEDIAGLMGEGPNEFTGRQEDEFLRGGFEIVDPTRLSTDAGMTAHRGDLSGDEYIAPEEIQAAVEASLGFTYADVSAAYTTGRPTAEQRQLRERIDSRLLALSRAGGNMTTLGETLGLGHATVERALARARNNEVTPVVARPAVTTRRVCFIHETPDATPRKRKHRGCPNNMLPVADRRHSTVNLSDRAYARGFDEKPGNPAYWEFRAKAGA
jgi:hypothetical protein